MNIIQYFKRLSSQGFQPTNVLDIGANVGQFTKDTKAIWPNAKYCMIEATRECEDHLKKIKEEYYIDLLGDTDGKIVPFYKTSNNTICTGNSIYREITPNYDDDKLIVENRTTKTLDTLLSGRSFDLIKLDTQGSEINILKGALRTIKKTRYIIMEIAIKEYNKGAPLLPEVLRFMKTIGFVSHKRLSSHKYKDQVIQVDHAFVRTEEKEKQND